MKGRKKVTFNAKRASDAQMRLHVDKACKRLLAHAGGRLSAIKPGMVKAAARKQKIPEAAIRKHLASMKGAAPTQ